MTSHSEKQYQLNNGTIITQIQLDHWNEKLQSLKPEEILEWAYLTFPNLSQITAFGLSGLVIIDLFNKNILESGKIVKNSNKDKIEETQPTPIPLIFVDTLHHFPQTYTLLEKVEQKYYTPYNLKPYIFKPQGLETEIEFANKHGDFLWDTNDDKYDYLVKVEPLNRAYKELKIDCVFTGRRQSQGAARGTLDIVEIDEINKVVKINPLYNWSFDDVRSYIDEHDVPYNELLDLGYKSVGDYHSTIPTGADGDERSGRWNGTVKTECGIHDPNRFLKFMDSK